MKTLEREAQKIAARFYREAQALFDDESMTEELASGEIFAALQMAQAYAEDCTNGERTK